MDDQQGKQQDSKYKMDIVPCGKNDFKPFKEPDGIFLFRQDLEFLKPALAIVFFRPGRSQHPGSD